MAQIPRLKCTKYTGKYYLAIVVYAALTFQDGDGEEGGGGVVVETVSDGHVTTNGVPGNVVSVYTTSMNTRVTTQPDKKVRAEMCPCEV